MAGDRLLPVRSFGAAQKLVGFPLFRTWDTPSEILVRLETDEKWATVRSCHRVGSVDFTSKQYAMDYFGHFAAPNKLYTTKPDHWRVYGATSVLRVTAGSAFHGRECDGTEAASFVSHGVHVELRVKHGRLGPRRTGRFYSALVPVSKKVMRTFDLLPLRSWNWSLRHRRIPGAAASPATGSLQWSEYTSHGLASLGVPRLPVAVPGWIPDSLGLTRPGRGVAARMLYRSHDRDSTLELLVERGPIRTRGRSRSPRPPLFDERPVISRGITGRRSSLFQWAYYSGKASGTKFTLVIPPGRSEVASDRHLVDAVVAGLGS